MCTVSLLNLTEIADGTLAFSSPRDQIHFSVSSIKSEGNRRGRPPRRNNAADISSEDKDQRFQKNVDDEAAASSNQKEIIALFRRIQSSISKGGSVTSTKTKPHVSSSKQSADVVLEVLRQYPSDNPVRGSRRSDKKTLDNERSSKSPVQPKDEAVDDSLVNTEFKLSRPASNFIKRSPIPLSLSRVKVDSNQTHDDGDDDSKVAVEESGRVGEMTLPELKELAKSKGIKGFSRLKKAELVDLLKNSV